MLYQTEEKVLKLYEKENPLSTLRKHKDSIQNCIVYFEEISMAHLARLASDRLFEGDRWIFSFERMAISVIFEKVGNGWWKLAKLETKKQSPFFIPGKKTDRVVYFMYC